MKKFESLTVLFICIVSLSFVACGNSQNTLSSKAQTMYNKKGMIGFDRFLEKHDYIPIRDESKNGATPFLLAIKNSDMERMNIFLQKGAEIIEKDNDGNDSIDYAIASGNSETINFIIHNTSDDYWNSIDENGLLPCVKFINKSKDFGIIQNVLYLTNNLSFVDSKNKSLLMFASQNNTDVRVAKFFLDNEINLIDKKNENEWTSVMYAARYNPNPSVMEDLILRGANTEPNSVGLTLTMLASCNKNPGVLFTLLKYKNEVKNYTTKGKTALMYACENQQDSSIIKMLIENGADINATDNDGKSALIYALENYEKPDVIYVLISAGVKTEITDKNGKTVSDYLAINEKLKTTDLETALGVAKLNNIKIEAVSEEKEILNSDENEAVTDLSNLDTNGQEVETGKEEVLNKDDDSSTDMTSDVVGTALDLE